MKTITLCMLLTASLMMAIPAVAQDYGTQLPVHIDGKDRVIWNTDWSPDGKWIAFSAKNIFIVSTESGETIQLTEEEINSDAEVDDGYFLPNFTPDGKEIIFSHLTIFKDEEGLNRGNWKLESIDITTGRHRIVMDEAASGSISRDGRYLTYIYSQDYQSDPANYQTMKHAVYDLEKDEITYYDFDWLDGFPHFDFGYSTMSPDNSHFLTTLRSEHYDVSPTPQSLYMVPLDGGEPEVLISESNPWNPDYSPDGKWILYTRVDYFIVNDDNPRDIYVYNTESGEIINLLPDNPFNSLDASWSPDGSQFCYFLERDGFYDLYIKDFGEAEEEIQVTVDEETPSGLALKGNYPNPFNPSTTIEYSLPVNGFADLVIYNLAGQKIRGLLSGTMSKGIHSVVWNGYDDSGLTVSNGVYLIQLRMGNVIKTGRMMLVK